MISLSESVIIALLAELLVSFALGYGLGRMLSKIMSLKSYLVGLDNNKALSTMSNSDLFNIRDEILADLNKFLYLLTFN